MMFQIRLEERHFINIYRYCFIAYPKSQRSSFLYSDFGASSDELLLDAQRFKKKDDVICIIKPMCSLEVVISSSLIDVKYTAE